MPRPALIAKLFIAVVVVAALLLYLADELLLRYRMGHGQALEAVTIYPAAVLKSGKTEIFRDKPEIEQCAHSLFPHAGYNPCWYVKRHRVRLV